MPCGGRLVLPGSASCVRSAGQRSRSRRSSARSTGSPPCWSALRTAERPHQVQRYLNRPRAPMRLTLPAAVVLRQRQQGGRLLGEFLWGGQRAERSAQHFTTPLSGEPAATNACCDDCGPAAEMGGGALLACRGGWSAPSP